MTDSTPPRTLRDEAFKAFWEKVAISPARFARTVDYKLVEDARFIWQTAWASGYFVCEERENHVGLHRTGDVVHGRLVHAWDERDEEIYGPPVAEPLCGSAELDGSGVTHAEYLVTCPDCLALLRGDSA